MALMDDVREAIRKQLPQEVGDQLQKYMHEAEKAKIDLAALIGAMSKREADMAKLTAAIVEQDGRLKLAGDIAKRELEVEKRERTLELTLAKAEAVHLREQRDTVIRLADSAFRNPRIIHRESESFPMLPSPTGQYPSQQASSKTRETEIQ
jgi:hypothetical protein